MGTIKYETYNVEDKTLLKLIKDNVEIFRMIGFTTFEQGKSYKLVFLSTDGPLNIKSEKSNNGKKITLSIGSGEQNTVVISTLGNGSKKTEFQVTRKDEKIHINCYKNHLKHIHNISVTKESKSEPNKMMMQMDENGIYIYKYENNNEKVLRYTDLQTTRELPYLIASYYESSKKEENCYKRLLEIKQYQERKGFYLETNHDYNGQLVFSRRSILLNRKDASSYALELIETKEVQTLIHYIFQHFEKSLHGFSYYVRQFPVNDQIFRNEIDSEIYRIYCGVQRKLHEMSNPIRIEQLLEEMTFEKEKTKTLKNKA